MAACLREEAEEGWWWNDGRILSIFSSPLFRRLILARHLVPSTNVCAHCGTNTRRRGRVWTHLGSSFSLPTHTPRQIHCFFDMKSYSDELHIIPRIRPPAALAPKAFCAYTPHTITHPNNESPSSQLLYSLTNKHTPAELAAIAG